MFIVAIASVVLLVCAARLFQYIKEWIAYVKDIDRIPGPSMLKGLTLAWEIASTPRYERFQISLRYIANFGLFFKVWLGPKPVVYIAEPEKAMVLLNSNKNIDKTFGYKFFYPWLGTGLLTSNGHKWHHKRKVLTPAFHFSILMNFFNTMVEQSKKLVEKLDEEVGTDRFDICPYLSNSALDVICETAMGVKLDRETDVSTYRTSIRRINQLVMYRAYCPWLWLDWMYKFSERYREQQEHLKVLHGFSTEVIRKRKLERKNQPENGLSSLQHSDDEKKQKPAFLDLLLELAESGAAELSDTAIREEVDTFMFEGHDTVSAALMWSIFWLGTHRDYQQKLYEELYSKFGDSDRDPTSSDINDLTYLDMVVKETLRRSPSVPMISRCLAEDIEVDGCKIPAGTTTIVSILRLHRNPSEWPYPEEFNPENFSQENVSRRHLYAFVPFSAGPRNCIGQKFGMMEVKVILSALFRRYEFETQVKFSELKIGTESVLYPESGVIVRIKKRCHGNNNSFQQ